MQNTTRTLTPYEQTLLAKAGLSHLKAQDIGQKPIEYVVGFVEFAEGKFKVDERALIPRVETESLVAMVASNIESQLQDIHPPKPFVIADVGCGSGAIGISLLKQLSQTNAITIQQKKIIKMFLSDISPLALELTKENATMILKKSDANKIDELNFIQSDLLKGLPTDQKVDLIVANLPYIPSEVIEKLDASVKNFEPRLALDGGDDGLVLIGQLLKQAPHYLATNGTVWLELDDSHTASVLQQRFPDWKIENFKDEFGRNRFAKLQLLA